MTKNKILIFIAALVAAIFMLCSCVDIEPAAEPKSENPTQAETQPAVTIPEAEPETETETEHEEEPKSENPTQEAAEVITWISEYYDGDNLFEANCYYVVPEGHIDAVIAAWDASGYDYNGVFEYPSGDGTAYYIDLYFKKRPQAQEYNNEYNESSWNGNSNSGNSGLAAEDPYGVYSLGASLYGMSADDVTYCLQILAREGGSCDWTLYKYGASVVLNRWIAGSYYGGGDGSYGRESMSAYGIHDCDCAVLAQAMQDRVPGLWYYHGMVPEAGYYNGCQHLEDAYYVSWAYGYPLGIWTADAPWY